MFVMVKTNPHFDKNMLIKVGTLDEAKGTSHYIARAIAEYLKVK